MRPTSIKVPGRADERGFNLVEVVVALGLLSGVLLTIAGLFALADRQLDGGRSHSIALNVARDILEETESWGFRQLHVNLGVAGTTASAVVDSRSATEAAEWQQYLESELGQAHAEIVLESIVESGSPPPLNAALAVRIRVVIFWTDGPDRARSLELATLRI